MPPTRGVAAGSTGTRSPLANLHLGGRTSTGQVHRNLAPAELYEYAIRHGEGVIADSVALAVMTKPHTGTLYAGETLPSSSACYTAKVAGTEDGVTETRAAFSVFFGAPFLPRHPRVYAGMLGEKLREHGSRVWLVNTGWTRGPHGVGTRIPLAHTRQLIRSVLDGSLDLRHTTTDPNFGLAILTTVPGVPSEILVPRGTWPDPTEYDAAPLHLTDLFHANFARYRSEVDPEVADAGPS